jgi:hypothetical protein
MNQVCARRGVQVAIPNSHDKSSTVQVAIPILSVIYISECYYESRAMNDRAQVKFQGPKYILACKEKNGILFHSQQEENDHFYIAHIYILCCTLFMGTKTEEVANWKD